MAGGKETPRQRMIGILYLVLLGLIALNVPDSLLDSFRNITNSLDQSTKNVSASLDNTYSTFKATKLKEQPEKAQKLLNKADSASLIAGELNKYIEDLKKELTEAGGGFNEDIGDVDARDNLDISPRIMITNKKAEVLKAKIISTREKLIQLLDPKDRAGVNFSLNANEPKQKKGTPDKTWEEAYFGDGIPLGATLTTLAKVQADNKNAESEVVKKILGKIDQAQITLNTFVPVVSAESNYIIQGKPYTAKIFLTASDSHSNPTITVDGASVPTSGGVGTYTVTASGEGKHTLNGKLSVKQVDGPPKTYDFSTTYTVARPSAVVSADKMNVLYMGVPNPISVSAPGVPKENLRVSITGGGGSISGSNGHYVAEVRNVAKDVAIIVKDDKGATLGSTLYRSKVLPPPIASFAGETGGTTSAANVRSAEKVFAVMKDFDFELKYNITEFTILVLKPRADAFFATTKGAALTPQMKTALSNVAPGTTVAFKNITALGPDGIPKKVQDLVLLAN